jgi:outer membrane receptor protein involved in Fe transport
VRGRTHRFKLGGEFDSVASGAQLHDRPYSIFDEVGNLKSLVTFFGNNFVEIRDREYGAFVQDRIAVSPKLQLELGLRYDRQRVVGNNNVSPRAAFSFLPLGTTRSKVSGGIGLFYDNVPLLNFQLPYLQRRYTTIYRDGAAIGVPVATAVRIDPQLRNPSALHWNLAWDYEWAKRWVSRVEYIQKTGRDQLRAAADPHSSGFDVIFNNSGTSHYRAIQVTLDRPIRTNLRFMGSYTFSETRGRPSLSLDFPDPAVELLPESPLDWNTPHRFVGWAYFPLPSQMTASLSVEARSGFPFTITNDLNQVVGGYNSHNMPAFFVTNASVEKQIPIPFGNGKRIAFRVAVTNLFNQFNPRYIDKNVNSPYFGTLADSSRRHFSARIRILKK